MVLYVLIFAMLYIYMFRSWYRGNYLRRTFTRI